MWLKEVDISIQQLEKYLPSTADNALDVGSEGENYRNTRQPWNKRFYDYLNEKKIKLFTMDLEPETKPDFVRNITQSVNDLGQFDLVVATHILEHVPLDLFDIGIKNIESLVNEGGLLLVSVPHKYPYHERPIDNMWRPTWEELKDVFKGKLLYGETFEVEHTSTEYIGLPRCQVSSILLKY